MLAGGAAIETFRTAMNNHCQKVGDALDKIGHGPFVEPSVHVLPEEEVSTSYGVGVDDGVAVGDDAGSYEVVEEASFFYPNFVLIIFLL